MRAAGTRVLVLVAGCVLAASACAGDGPPPPSVSVTLLAVSPGDPLRIAGSGALTPLVERWVAAWSSVGGRPAAIVEESLGSSGGIRAVSDGVIDIGLAARPLEDGERGAALTLDLVGLDAVILAANPSVAVDGLTGAELVALTSGQARTFSDGVPATMLLRDVGESANATLERAVPGLAAAREQAYRDGRLRVLYHDDAMAEALAARHGAVGVYSLSALIAGGARLKALSLDGVMPSPALTADGRWPATRPLSLVSRRDRAARLAPFLDFVFSTEGRAIALRSGVMMPERQRRASP